MRSRRAVTAFLVAIGVLMTLPVDARASYTNTVSQSGSVTTALLAAPTGVSAVRGACSTLAGTVKANISWTASTSPQTTGYDILRSTTSGSGYAVVGSVSGIGTTSFIDSTVAHSTTYFYVVQSSRNLWRSVNSNEDSMRTPNSLCIGGSD